MAPPDHIWIIEFCKGDSVCHVDDKYVKSEAQIGIETFKGENSPKINFSTCCISPLVNSASDSAAPLTKPENYDPCE